MDVQGDGDEQCHRMLNHLCQIMEPWSTNHEDMTLRGSLMVICSQATVLGHKFTRLGPRYKFTCSSSANSLTLCPSVHQVTDSVIRASKTASKRLVRADLGEGRSWGVVDW
jgi:hypothetical protein